MADSVAEQIDRQVDFLYRCRAVFPRLDSGLVGAMQFEASEYLQKRGHHFVMELATPLTKEAIAELNEIAHWLNENFVVRLYAVMESHQLVSNNIKIRQDLDGHEELDILRRLRNQIGHGSKGYDINDPQKVELYTRIVTHFGIKRDYSYLEVDKYPIGIGRVLVPLAEGCKRYSAAHATAAAVNQFNEIEGNETI